MTAFGNLENDLSGNERDPGESYTPDQFATLLRLLQVFNPFYDPNANNIVDSRGVSGTNADLAFGGAGHDVFIGNTASDRMYDENGPTTSLERGLRPVGRRTRARSRSPPTSGRSRSSCSTSASRSAPTRRGAETLPPAPQSTDFVIRNGEPFGELGMIDPANAALVALDDGRGATPPTPWPWTGGENPGLTVPTFTDAGIDDGDYYQPYRHPLRLGSLTTPSSHPSLIAGIQNLTVYDKALLNRIVIRGQLTAAEQAALATLNQTALAHLITLGLVVQTGSIWIPTALTWLDIGLAPPPVITSVILGSNTIPTIVSGTGDVTDTITLYDNGVAVARGTTFVHSDGTWTTAVVLAAGRHILTATETVDELPQVGLTSVPSAVVPGDDARGDPGRAGDLHLVACDSGADRAAGHAGHGRRCRDAGRTPHALRQRQLGRDDDRRARTAPGRSPSSSMPTRTRRQARRHRSASSR